MMHFAEQIILNDIVRAGDVAEAADEDAAEEGQCRSRSDRVVHRTAQESFLDITRTWQVSSPDGHCADPRPRKRIKRLWCHARSARVCTAGRATTANSNLPQATADRIVTSHQ